MMKRLTEKRALVTGAARGIGQAIAKAFRDEGAKVVVMDVDGNLGRDFADSICAEFILFDVSSEENWLALEETHPNIDILVNNAGITGFESGPVPHDPENTSLENWRKVHRVNLDGTFLGCRYAIRAMKRAMTGSIINISSRSGMVGIPAAAAYASSKAGIRNHTKSVALYCAQNGWNIRCNSIHPAAILTPMWEPMLGQGPERETNKAAFIADTPQKRFGDPEEVAALAVLLASDEAKYITGAEITIDGGILAGAASGPSQPASRMPDA